VCAIGWWFSERSSCAAGGSRTDMWLVLSLVKDCRFPSLQLHKGHPRSIPVASSRRTPLHAWVALPVRAHWSERTNILSVALANPSLQLSPGDVCREVPAAVATEDSAELQFREVRPGHEPLGALELTPRASRVRTASCASTSDIAEKSGSSSCRGHSTGPR
jgi:hypothetical protein